MPARIVTTHYRYKRPPRTRKAVALEGPAIVGKRARPADAPTPGPANDDRPAVIVTAKRPRNGWVEPLLAAHVFTVKFCEVCPVGEQAGVRIGEVRPNVATFLHPLAQRVLLTEIFGRCLDNGFGADQSVRLPVQATSDHPAQDRGPLGLELYL